ncbi:MAG: glycoside hydrolase family 127 protein [Kiritimatiellae bacterium]|nr:glycoside hydrolase family 127 protein [Kiritimatiellia bacterium]
MKRTVAWACGVGAALVAGAATPDAMENIGNVTLKGYLGDRLDAMIERHVIGTDVDYITAPFMEKTERKRWWQTEFWGKYMHSAMPYLAYTGSERLRASVDRGVARILASQEPSGYIGNYPDELRCGEGWDVWGMKYTMMGLLHYYDGTKDRKALDGARRVCDYVIGEIGPNGARGRELWETGNWCGYASSSILEPVMWLYNRTREKKYLDFATFLVKGMTEPEGGPRLLDLALKGVSVADRNGYGNKAETHGGYVMKHNRWKSYEMMSCYQGLIEYYEVTGRKDLLDAAVATGKDIIKEEINLAGGCACSEAWFHGARKQHLPYIRLQETCVTTTWMRFCEKLLDITGDTAWADQLERTFYNAYLGAMKADGAEFAGYTPLTGNRYHGQHHCYMHTDCCTANGPRGFLCFLKQLFRAKGDAAEFNFYASALVKGTLANGKKVAFDMYSLYPRGDFARIVSHTEKAGVVPLRLRIPAWSADTVVKLNGRKLDGVKAGGYFTVAHEWILGDIVEIQFDMPVVAHTIDHNVAFTRGPVLLARDSRLDNGDQTQVFRRGIKDGQPMAGFASVRSPCDGIWMAFSATLQMGSHHENPEGRYPETVFFCDYASAGNTWARDNYYRTWFPIEYGITE